MYLDILEVKAQRLKTLTEDVVEASKVSSGNITLEYMDIDFREMVQQTEGEMAEKFAARNLSVVLNLPEEAAVIHVDGRRMWSRYHVVITKKGSDYYAADQKSSNFTFVNGVQLNPYQETLLTDRSTLKISDEEFEFHAS